MQTGGKHRVVGTLTVIGIFSCHCPVIRVSSKMAPSLNDTWIHGSLAFRVVPELPTRNAFLASRLLDIRCC